MPNFLQPYQVRHRTLFISAKKKTSFIGLGKYLTENTTVGKDHAWRDIINLGRFPSKGSVICPISGYNQNVSDISHWNKTPNIKLHENPSGGTRRDASGRT